MAARLPHHAMAARPLSLGWRRGGEAPRPNVEEGRGGGGVTGIGRPPVVAASVEEGRGVARVEEGRGALRGALTAICSPRLSIQRQSAGGDGMAPIAMYNPCLLLEDGVVGTEVLRPGRGACSHQPTIADVKSKFGAVR
ncbi:hypothetical protein PR202_ga13020 [Eleusine coracana subsp. coracana]|uniref:Uncharacterized protein n=1 Tax=Eleusine coracana subsp. coracana TaxID=191504 RepID=A0AAV5CDT2_ELECO|nr:hypothetical protein PR202_ga13020 [Eleusine coracana subsp. coracana]